MAGSIVMIRQKTTDLKRRFRERTAERRNRSGGIRDEAERHSKHSISRNSSSDDLSSNMMMNFAIASSTIASNCNSEQDYQKASKHSNLYQRSSKQEQTQVVFPNINKRDIYLASRNHKEPKPAKAVQKVVDHRGVMNDISNDRDEAKTNLPAFSLTGSMLCRELENNRVRQNGTKANQTMLSPQKPLGLPSNTIMASMLFRTLQEEEEKTKASGTTNNSKNQYAAKFNIPTEVVHSPTARSIVSEITQHTKESSVDPKMVDASHNLLRILQSNRFQSFDDDAKPQPSRRASSLYEA